MQDAEKLAALKLAKNQRQQFGCLESTLALSRAAQLTCFSW